MTDARRGLTAFAAFATAAVLMLVLTSLLRPAPLQSALSTVTVPISRAVTATGSGLRQTAERVTSDGLLEENRALRAEVERLRTENVRLKGLQLENDQLRQQLGFSAANPTLQLLTARVVGRDPSSLRQYVTVDRGESAGVQPGMAVVHPGGALVGQVASVTPDTSQVLLVTDVDSSVSAKIERTRADGIVEGRWQKGAFMLMRYIEQGVTTEGEPRVQPGDWVVTSGLGGIVPSGLLIGQVQTVKQTDSGLEQQAEIVPAVDVRSVESVLIVTSRGQ